MTHTTDKEQPDTTVFKQLLDDYKQCLLHGDLYDAGAARLAVVAEYEKAARRAQVKYCKEWGDSSTSMINGCVVAPKSPEATVNDSLTVEADQVQMPEPVAYLHECGKKPSLRTLEFSKVAIQLSAKGYKSMPLYTEHQVRQLLAERGIK